MHVTCDPPQNIGVANFQHRVLLPFYMWFTRIRKSASRKFWKNIYL